MPQEAPRRGLSDDNLILTPSKLRLHSHVFGAYVTSVWLPHAAFAGLLLWKASDLQTVLSLLSSRNTAHIFVRLCRLATLLL